MAMFRLLSISLLLCLNALFSAAMAAQCMAGVPANYTPVEVDTDAAVARRVHLNFAKIQVKIKYLVFA